MSESNEVENVVLCAWCLTSPGTHSPGCHTWNLICDDCAAEWQSELLRLEWTPRTPEDNS